MKLNLYLNSVKLEETLKTLSATIYENVKELKSSLEELKYSLSKDDITKYNKEYLDKLSLEEIDELLFMYNGNNHNIFRKIINYYIKRLAIETARKSLNNLIRIVKKLKNLNKKCIQNKRERIRKIYSFYFKNLDDTHSFVTLN